MSTLWYRWGAKYKFPAYDSVTSSTFDSLGAGFEHTCVACNDICHIDVLAYMFLILIILPSRVYGPKRHTILRIFLRYVSSLLWRLGVAPVSTLTVECSY